eukprot:3041449-Rhodomonas_salina.1
MPLKSTASNPAVLLVVSGTASSCSFSLSLSFGVGVGCFVWEFANVIRSVKGAKCVFVDVGPDAALLLLDLPVLSIHHGLCGLLLPPLRLRANAARQRGGRARVLKRREKRKGRGSVCGERVSEGVSE